MIQDKLEDLNTLWTKINAEPNKGPNQTTETAQGDGTIIIKRTYEFAGKIVR